MIRFADYVDRFRNIAFERDDDGILVMRIHRDGGPAKWAAAEGALHDQLSKALWFAGHDPENRVVIFTGTGDTFLTDRVVEEYPPTTPPTTSA